MAYPKGLLSRKTHDALIKWSREITERMLKPLNLQYHSIYGYQTWQDGNLFGWAPSHKVKWPFDLLKSRDKAKPSYLHIHSIYGHQTW